MTSTPTKLHAINALVKGYKPQALREFTDVHHTVKKAPLLTGISRTYQPNIDGEEVLPSESTNVQVNVEDVLPRVAATLTRLFDLQLTQDATNRVATADVTINGTVVLADAPVTYLLFLEKQLVDLRTFIEGLPTLDPAETWAYDANRACYASQPAKTIRTKKVLRNHVVAEATEQHPAQVQVYQEDVSAGTWTTTKLSGALPGTRVRELRNRVAALIDAVKLARESANDMEVVDRRAGDQVFAYLFGTVTSTPGSGGSAARREG